MISLFTGTPGSGKSLHLAQIIYNRCYHELLTIGNFEVNRDVLDGSEWFQYIDNQELTPDVLIDISKGYFSEHKFKEGAIYLIIDEAQLIFNVREWNLVGRSDWIHFFTQHRKLGYDIILVAQFDKMLDKQLRSLCEYEFIHRKMSNFGWKGKMISMWTGNRLFMCVQRWYPLNERVGGSTFLYTKKLGALYDTLGLFSKPDANKQVLKKKGYKVVSDQKEKETLSDDLAITFEDFNIV